jgi:hypothetical protein
VGTDYINHHFVKVKQDGDLPLCVMQHQPHSLQKRSAPQILTNGFITNLFPSNIVSVDLFTTTEYRTNFGALHFSGLFWQQQMQLLMSAGSPDLLSQLFHFVISYNM